MNPLHSACEWGSTRTVRALLYIQGHRGINSKDHSGCTPLHLASKGGHLEIVELLLSKSSFTRHNSSTCDDNDLCNDDIVNSKCDTNSWTPLHFASHYGHLPVVVCLVDNGASINAVALFGTPLHCAIRKGHNKIVQYLLLKGAVVNNNQLLVETSSTLSMTPLSLGPSALDVACQQGNRKIVNSLLEKGAIIDDDSIHYSIKHTRLLRTLIKEGANICSRKNGKSIFDYDWLDSLLSVDRFCNVLSNPDHFRCWNLLALICWNAYGKAQHIELFQLIDDKEQQNIKLPEKGSKYLSPKYIDIPSDVDVSESVNEEAHENNETGEPAREAGQETAATVAPAQIPAPPVGATVASTTTTVPSTATVEEVRILMTESDSKTLKVILEELNIIVRQEKQQDEEEDDVVIQQRRLDQYFANLGINEIPNFRKASYDDYNWMVHAAASIPVCPLRVVQFLCKSCFPNQVRVQRLGCTPLLLACQRQCSDYSTTSQQQQQQQQHNSYIKHSETKQECSVLLTQTNKATAINTECSDEVIRYLLRTFPIAASVSDDNDELPLLHAFRTRKTKCIQELIDAYPEALKVSVAAATCQPTSCMYIFDLANVVTLNVLFQLIRYNPPTLLEARRTLMQQQHRQQQNGGNVVAEEPILTEEHEGG